MTIKMIEWQMDKVDETQKLDEKIYDGLNDCVYYYIKEELDLSADSEERDLLIMMLDKLAHDYQICDKFIAYWKKFLSEYEDNKELSQRIRDIEASHAEMQLRLFI